MDIRTAPSTRHDGVGFLLPFHSFRGKSIVITNFRPCPPLNATDKGREVIDGAFHYRNTGEEEGRCGAKWF